VEDYQRYILVKVFVLRQFTSTFIQRNQKDIIFGNYYLMPGKRG